MSLFEGTFFLESFLGTGKVTQVKSTAALGEDLSLGPSTYMG